MSDNIRELIHDACQKAIYVFSEELNADQCREVAEYMREVFLVAGVLARQTGQESPDIVKVPRKLLEDAATWLEAYSPGSGSEESYTAQDLRTILAGDNKHD